MPGVTITLTNQGTNAVREVQTNESGLYVMPAIPPGVYTLKATLTGFRTLERKDIEVQVGSANRIAVTLEVGAAHRGRRDHRRRAAAPDRELGGRHGHREPRHRRAAAERPQLPAARLAHPGRHDQRPVVEPGQAAHGRPAQQLRAERRRPAHPLQPLLARRRREHRPELQLLHAAAVGRRAAGVQRRGRPVRRRVRPRHRADQRVDQVGHEPVPRHASSSSRATRRSTPRTTSIAPTGRSRRSGATSTARTVGGPVVIPKLVERHATGCSSCSTGKACARPSR